MKRLLICLIVLFLLIGISTMPLKVHADYNNDININSDGSITPSVAPMSTVDNITYMLTENMIGRIFIYRDNITLDGSGAIIKPPAGQEHMLVGGIRSDGTVNVTIMNCNVNSFNGGMVFLSCSNLTIRGNNLTDNLNAISPLYANNVVISNNILDIDHTEGIGAGSSNYLSIFNNSISESLNGISLQNCNNSIVEANRMINDLFSVEISHSYNNSVLKNEIVGNMTNHGVWLDSSSNNVVADNNVSENNEGFYLFNASENIITGNKTSFFCIELCPEYIDYLSEILKPYMK